METWSQGRETRKPDVAQRGGGSVGGAMGSLTCSCGGKKLGGIPWEGVIPALDQTTQPRVPEPRR